MKKTFMRYPEVCGTLQMLENRGTLLLQYNEDYENHGTPGGPDCGYGTPRHLSLYFALKMFMYRRGPVAEWIVE